MWRYVIEDGSPYRRSSKQNRPPGQGGAAGKGRAPVEDFDDDGCGWSFTSLMKKDSIKDSIPDQQLGQQELTVRYSSKNFFFITLVLKKFFTLFGVSSCMQISH